MPFRLGNSARESLSSAVKFKGRRQGSSSDTSAPSGLPLAKQAHLLTRRAIKANGRGECFEAITETEVALAALSLFENVSVAAPLRQQLALGLARAGELGEAGEVLRDLLVTRAPDGETLGLLGSVSKRLAESSSSPAVAQIHLQNALDFYKAGFLQHRDPYCAINAAACSALLGDQDVARALAGEVLRLPSCGDDYWDEATRAEAFLIQGEAEKALAAYARAAALAGDRWADLATTRKQCRRLCAQLYGKTALLDKVFGIWSVAMVAGSVDDAANRQALGSHIARWLRSRGVVCLWVSACADPFIGVEAIRTGVEVCVLLPTTRSEFLRRIPAGAHSSVPDDWQYLLDSARTVVEMSNCSESGNYDKRLLLQCMTTSAASRASVLDSNLYGLVCCSGGLSAAEVWQNVGVQVDLLELAGGVFKSSSLATASRKGSSAKDATEAQRLRAAREFRALAQELLLQSKR